MADAEEVHEFVKYLTKCPKPITVKKPDELTFEGINTHKVLTFADGQLKMDALKELLRRSRKVTTVVFVDDPVTVSTLVRDMQVLSHDGWKVLPLSGIKNKKLRDKKMQALSQSDHLPRVFITAEVLSSSDRCSWFDFQKVRLAVNYDLGFDNPKCYLHRMGRFREVDAIYFVDGDHWNTIFEIQREYNVDFEIGPIQWPAGFCQSEGWQVEHTGAAQDIRHFYFKAHHLAIEGKLAEFLDTVMNKITPTKAVVFVNDLHQVKFLCGEVEGTYGKLIDRGEFQIFTDYLEFQLCEGCCMLIIHDKAILDIVPPKNVPWVINYDLPSTMALYDLRSAWCKRGGVVVHIVVRHDWLKVFYIPIRYNCYLPRLPKDVPDLV